MVCRAAFLVVGRINKLSLPGPEAKLTRSDRQACPASKLCWESTPGGLPSEEVTRPCPRREPPC